MFLLIPIFALNVHMSIQILKLLMGKMDAKEHKNQSGFELKSSCCEEDKKPFTHQVYNLQKPNTRLTSCSDHTTLLTSAKNTHHRQLKDYLEEQQ